MMLARAAAAAASASPSASPAFGNGSSFAAPSSSSQKPAIANTGIRPRFSASNSSFSRVSLIRPAFTFSSPRSSPSIFCSASVGGRTVETEPNTGVQFPTLIKPPGNSSNLSLVGKGFREKNIAFIRVKVYAIGMYFSSDIATYLSSSWKGKNKDNLSQDPGFFKEVLEVPVDKGILIVLVRDVDGATFWGALDEALAPRLKSGTKADKDALSAFGDVFRGRAFKQGTSIYLTWVQPFKLQVALLGNSSMPQTVEATIDSAALVLALFDVYLGETPVSPTLKESTAVGLQALL